LTNIVYQLIKISMPLIDVYLNEIKGIMVKE